MPRENYAKVRERIRSACAIAGRAPGSVRLVAITKNQPPGRILEALSLGISEFGENRIQEAERKIRELRSSKGAKAITWHFVGALQANKVRKAAKYFELIHSVSSLNIAELLNDAAVKQNKAQKILLQVNVSGELTKGGFSPAELENSFPKLLQSKNLSILGLMTIAPLSNNPEDSRTHFRSLRLLRDILQEKYSHPMPELSMGMSADFGIAIGEGATMVRIGRALFVE